MSKFSIEDFVSLHVYKHQSQNMLVNHLLEKEIFAFDDITNLIDDEGVEATAFYWFNCSDWWANAMEKMGDPVLRTDFGNWWSRTGCGNSIEEDYNTEELYKKIRR